MSNSIVNMLPSIVAYEDSDDFTEEEEETRVIGQTEVTEEDLASKQSDRNKTDGQFGDEWPQGMKDEEWADKGWQFLFDYGVDRFKGGSKGMPHYKNWPLLRYRNIGVRNPGPVTTDGDDEMFYIDRVVGRAEAKYPEEDNDFVEVFAVVWAGWSSNLSTLEPRENLDPTLIQEYEEFVKKLKPASRGRGCRALAKIRVLPKIRQLEWNPSVRELPELQKLFDLEEKRTGDVILSRGNGFRG